MGFNTEIGGVRLVRTAVCFRERNCSADHKQKQQYRIPQALPIAHSVSASSIHMVSLAIAVLRRYKRRAFPPIEAAPPFLAKETWPPERLLRSWMRLPARRC